MRNTSRASYRTASAAYTVEGFFCTFFKFASLSVCNILHNIQVLCTCFCTCITSDTAVDFRIQFHHDLLGRSDLFDVVSSLVCREEWNACYIHTFLNLCLTGKTCFQFVLSFDSINSCTCSTESMTAATSSFQGVACIFHSCHDC